jgi:hypothetical protein
MSNPNQFGSMVTYAEPSVHTPRGARGLLLPPSLGIGSVHEDVLLPETMAELIDLNPRPSEAAFDRGFSTKATLATMAPWAGKVFIAGSPNNSGSRRTNGAWLVIPSAARAAFPISSANTTPTAPD